MWGRGGGVTSHTELQYYLSLMNQQVRVCVCVCVWGGGGGEGGGD